MKSIIQKITFKTSPKVLYEIFLDSKKHTEATGGKAVANARVGGSYSAWDGYIKGKNLALIPGRLIVQTWRAADFKSTDHDSILVLSFEKAHSGTLLTMTHTAVPGKQADHFKTGWFKHYWTPIKKYLAEK
jgi:activator of HSP90 ATPase